MNKKHVNDRRLTNQHNRLVTSEINGENTGSIAKLVREDFVQNKTKEVIKNFTQNKTTISREEMKSVIFGLLQEQYPDCNVSKEEKSGGFTEISIVSRRVKPKSTGQISITLKPDGDVDIYINPYDHYEEFYYTMLDVPSTDCLRYKEQFHRIIEGQSVERVLPGMFKKVEYPNYDDFDPSEWGTGIPETYSQEEYEKIAKEKGEKAALEYAQSFQKK